MRQNKSSLSRKITEDFKKSKTYASIALLTRVMLDTFVQTICRSVSAASSIIHANGIFKVASGFPTEILAAQTASIYLNTR